MRYKQVDIVRVPDKELEAWRAANKSRCECDALLPKFASGMKFAVLTKTHFTHANLVPRHVQQLEYVHGPSLSLPRSTRSRSGRIGIGHCKKQQNK